MAGKGFAKVDSIAEAPPTKSPPAKKVKALPEPKTFKWTPASGGAPPSIVVYHNTDVTEVLPFLDEYNAGVLAYVKTQVKKVHEGLMPTPVTEVDLMADIRIDAANQRTGAELLAELGVVEVKTDGDNESNVVSFDSEENIFLDPDGSAFDEPLVVAGGDKVVGVSSRKMWKTASRGNNAFLPRVVFPDGKTRWPENRDEMRLVTALQATLQQRHFRDIYAAAIYTDEAIDAIERKPQVLARFQEMVARTPEVRVIDVMPIHLQATGTSWGTQQRGEILRYRMSNHGIASSEGQLTVYCGLAWAVWLKLNGVTLAGRVYVKEDGRFLLSQWCQRELTKEHGNEAYGGASMRHTLLTWALGPGFSKTSYGGPGSSTERNALRPYKPPESYKEKVHNPGDAAGIELARYLFDEAKDIQLTEDPIRVGVKSPYPVVWCNSIAAILTPKEMPEGKVMSYTPWLWFHLSVMLPTGIANVVGEIRHLLIKSDDMLIATPQFKDVALKKHPEYTTLATDRASSKPLCFYNIKLTSPETQLEVLKRLGWQDQHPVREVQAAIIQKVSEPTKGGE